MKKLNDNNKKDDDDYYDDLTILLPREARRRNPTGLTDQSNEAAHGHRQSRHFIRATDTRRNWGEWKSETYLYNILQIKTFAFYKYIEVVFKMYFINELP